MERIFWFWHIPQAALSAPRRLFRHRSYSRSRIECIWHCILMIQIFLHTLGIFIPHSILVHLDTVVKHYVPQHALRDSVPGFRSSDL